MGRGSIKLEKIFGTPAGFSRLRARSPPSAAGCGEGQLCPQRAADRAVAALSQLSAGPEKRKSADRHEEAGRGRDREEPEETQPRAVPGVALLPEAGLVTMAGLNIGLTVPVWLAEDDLGCIICQGLLAWPVTLPCGHSFCRNCLKGLWGAQRLWSCPTCREGAAQQLDLRKNTLLQDLADKYSRAVGELEGGQGGTPIPAPAPAPAPGPQRRTGQLRVGWRVWCSLLSEQPAPLAPLSSHGSFSLPHPFYFHITFLHLKVEPTLRKVQKSMKKQEKQFS